SLHGQARIAFHLRDNRFHTHQSACQPPGASGVESCTVSSSLPIPARNKQDMQPSPPPGVSSRGSPQLGHVGVSLANGTLGIKVKSHVKIKPASRQLATNVPPIK